jgi:hypothetical protein
VATEAALRRLRQKHKGAPAGEKPFFIDERSWAVFAAYVYEDLTLAQIQERMRISLRRMRQILLDVDARLELPRDGGSEWNDITPQSPIEDLALSIRARNALHNLGCHSVHDILQLDLSASLPRLGGKTRVEVVVALQRAGFRHPALDRGAAAGITSVSRRLDRMQERIDLALRSVAKEVAAIQRQLQVWLKK